MRLLPPLLLHYYITYRCNCRCVFCDIRLMEGLRGKPDAQLQSVKKNLAQAKEIGVRFVDFTGGEPLMHRDLPDMLEYAQSFGLRTSVTTNCLLYPERAQELKGLVNYLHFSLDGAEARQHDQMRGAVVFNRVLESIDCARKLGEKPDLLFTVTPENLTALPLLCKVSNRLGLILIVNPVFSHLEARNLSPELLDDLDRCADKPFVYVNKAILQFKKLGGNDTKNPRCRVMQSTIVISPDDCLLLPCFHFAQRSIPVDRPLREIRSSREVQQFFSLSGRSPFCKDCTLNCYFDSSFVYKVDAYFWKSLYAKVRYAFYRNAVRRFRDSLGGLDTQPASITFQSITRNGQ